MAPNDNPTVVNGVQAAAAQTQPAPAVSSSGVPNPPSSPAPKAARKAGDGTAWPTKPLDANYFLVIEHRDLEQITQLHTGMGMTWDQIFTYLHRKPEAPAPVAQPATPVAAAPAPKPAPAYVPQASETPAQELARLRAENAALKAGTIGKVTFHVSEGGTYKDSRTGEEKTSAGGNMVIRGLSGKYGLTFYKQAVAWLWGNPNVKGDMGHADEVRAWVKANYDKLSDKPEK
jgi:hypothetical protein